MLSAIHKECRKALHAECRWIVVALNILLREAKRSLLNIQVTIKYDSIRFIFCVKHKYQLHSHTIPCKELVHCYFN